MLMRPRMQLGFTLTEVLIGLAIVALLLGLAAPSMGVWIQNTQLRSAADSILAGLQQARVEALRRNAPVAFRLTSTTGNVTWQICLYDMVANACSTATNAVLNTRAKQEGGGNARVGAENPLTDPTVALAAGANIPATVAFDAMGRPLTTPIDAFARVDVRNPTLASTDERRLVIIVSPAGQVRMCDPSLAKATNPQGCV
jgi:type IV fimbrial biogenesis protein FimT